MSHKNLQVHLIGGHGLYNADAKSGSLSDPFCKMWVCSGSGLSPHSQVVTSKVKDDTLDPVWDEKWTLNIVPQFKEGFLYVQCWDKDKFGKDSLGNLRVPLAGLKQGVEVVKKYPLSKQGDIEIGLTALNFSTPDPVEAAAVASVSATATAEKGPGFGDILPVSAYTSAANRIDRHEQTDPAKFHPGPLIDVGAGSKVQFFFNKTCYLPGEDVVGKVVFDMAAATPVTQNPISIEFKCVEKSSIDYYVWVKDTGSKWHHYEKRLEKKQRVVFSQTNPLTTVANNTIPAGKSSYAFSYKLPADAPVSNFFAYHPASGEKSTYKPDDMWITSLLYKVKVSGVYRRNAGFKATDSFVVSSPDLVKVNPLKFQATDAGHSVKVDFSIEVNNAVLTPGGTILIRADIKAMREFKRVEVEVRDLLLTTIPPENKELDKKALIHLTPYVLDKPTKEFSGVLAYKFPEDGVTAIKSQFFEHQLKLYLNVDFPGPDDPFVAIPVLIAPCPAPGSERTIFNEYAKNKAKLNANS